MKNLLWPLLVAVICLPVVLLAVGVKLPFLDDAPAGPAPLKVPGGDREIAWIHTTTNANTWERFVTGLMRLSMTHPKLAVDDSRAFGEATTGVPEVVLSRTDRPGAGHVRIRWYKLRNDATTEQWVTALAARDPAPIAVIGGGSTDRARDLARAMDEQPNWHGDCPPLLVTTATADFEDRDESKRLVDIYDDRTFRFCFSNRQMADAVLDFVFQSADLAVVRPVVHRVLWQDDPYSLDLGGQFAKALREKYADRVTVSLDDPNLTYSVGGSLRPNLPEVEAIEILRQQLRRSKDGPVLLVLPTSVQPARRFLRGLLEAEPTLVGRLVVATGDGVPVNAILRDGDYAWPTAALPVPLVLFAHGHPLDWDGGDPTRKPPDGYAFTWPNTTEEAAHFNRLGAVLVATLFPATGEDATRGQTIIDRLKARTDFFDPNGERKADTGEHVVVVRPRTANAAASLGVWKRETAKWVLVTSEPIDGRREGDR